MSANDVFWWTVMHLPVVVIVGIFLVPLLVMGVKHIIEGRQVPKRQRELKHTTPALFVDLTPEQTAWFPDFVEKWRRIGLSTEPADRPRAEQAIRTIYEAAKLKPPKVVWCMSPLGIVLTRAYLAQRSAVMKERTTERARDFTNFINRTTWWSRRELDGIEQSIRATDESAVSTDGPVAAAIRLNVPIEQHYVYSPDCANTPVGGLVWGVVQERVAVSLRGVTELVDSGIYNGPWTEDTVTVSIGDETISVRAIVEASVKNSCYGQDDASRLAFLDCLRSVCGLVKETDRMTGHFEQAQAAGWYLPHEHICWVSERHNVLHLNNRDLLHCEDGPALAYPDGWSFYALNGVPMKPEYVMTPADKLDTQVILKEQNVDIRRELLRKVGVSRLIAHGKEVDRQGTYRLIDMSAVFREDLEDDISYAPYLLMQSPSVDGAQHLEGVSPECRTVEQAINWRASEVAKNWNPDSLS